MRGATAAWVAAVASGSIVRMVPVVPSFPTHFAFYGTLRRDGSAAARLGLSDALTWIGPCRIPGRLYRVTWYPALVQGEGSVVGDLFAVEDEAAVAVLDRFEGYDPAQPAESLYVRRPVELVDPGTSAWAYVWNGTMDGLTFISSGDWLEGEAPA